MSRVRRPDTALGAGETGSPLYNRTLALGRLRGNEHLLRDLAQIFHEDLPGHIQRLKEGVGEGDDRLIARVAHTLRGLGASFDAKAVVLAADRLEQAIGRAHAYEVRQLAERLHFDVQALDEALGAERSPDSEL